MNFLEELGITEEDNIEIEEYDPSIHINKGNLKELEDEVDDYYDEKAVDYDIIENKSLINNIVNFTRLKDEIVSDPDYEDYNNFIEEIRMFPKNFLKDRGIFLSLSKQDTIESYPYLRNSSLYQTSTDEAYGDRYMLPICLPNGNVVIHTGYRPISFNMEGPKYETSFYDWMSQGSIMGNMESIEIYHPKKKIYVVEGMFDAYRINQVLEYPSIAMLGSTLTKEKLTILNILKNKGYELILVPDQDESGLKESLINNKLFSNIMMYGDREKDKDFDAFCGNCYIEKLNSKLNKGKAEELHTKNFSLFDLNDDEITEVNNHIKSILKYKYDHSKMDSSSIDIFNFL